MPKEKKAPTKRRVVVEEVADEPVTSKVNTPRQAPSVNESKVAETVDITKPESTPQVSSFSMLDSEKKTEKVPDEKPAVFASDIKEENKPAAEIVSDPEPVEEVAGEAVENQSKMSSDEIKDWLKDIRPDTTKEVQKSGGPDLKVFLVMLIAIALTGLVVGGFFYYNSKIAGRTTSSENTEVTANTETETPAAETSTPEPTKSASKVDLTKVKVNVLNGNGIPGEASKVKDMLVKAGFKDIKTANAASSDVKETTVSMKKATDEGIFGTIKESLTGYEAKLSDKQLEDSSPYDVVVTIGAK